MINRGWGALGKMLSVFYCGFLCPCDGALWFLLVGSCLCEYTAPKSGCCIFRQIIMFKHVSTTKSVVVYPNVCIGKFVILVLVICMINLIR